MTVVSIKEKHDKEIVPGLVEILGLRNVMQAPRLKKIVLNMGVGSATQNSKIVDEAVNTLSIITGQKATITRSKKAISNFKLRENMPIGAKVTLHGGRMWDFLERLINFSLPRVKDFKGISNKSFDGMGNYNLGIKEQIIFLEVDFDKVSKVMGLDINFVTSSTDDKGCKALLTSLGLPFRKPSN